MGQVIPYSRGMWMTMGLLKSSVKFMQGRNGNGRFNDAIEKEDALFKDYVNQYKVQELIQ